MKEYRKEQEVILQEELITSNTKKVAKYNEYNLKG